MARAGDVASRGQGPDVPPSDGAEAAQPAAEATPEHGAQPPEGHPSGSGGEAPEAPERAPEELGRELEAARREAAEQREAVLRARAELENLRKRTAREVENAHKYGLESFLRELLPVKDSIERGLGVSDAEVDVDSLREGLELTLRQLVQATEKFGLSEVDPGGEPFDPRYHQAMSMQEVEGAESGTVVAVIQKGYLLNDRLVRPAMVIVAK